ncbi:MAG: right-handed parallel beta-helix repeat-containing protein [Niastella sp.]|nr:right-handed parallel beta-helix repeat-containing protein [Niastella sp.]
MKMKLLYLVVATLLGSSAFTQVCIDSAVLFAPATYNGNAPSIISGRRISNANGACLTLNNCHNITISNCILGGASAPAIVLEGCTNIMIINCLFKDMNNGVYALNSQGIKVNYNQFQNVHHGNSRGQFVQFNNVSGAGNEVMYNVGENIPGNSSPEDLINMYKSSGTVSSPILIKGNKLRGGGPSGSGGGIMTGDDGGSYITVEDNILVDPGQYGIAIASGTHIKLLSNKVYGRQQSFTNIGLYVWNQYAAACSTNTVEYNVINFTNNGGTLNPAWDAGNCGPVAGWNNNTWNAPISDTILPSRILCPELTAYYRFNNSWSDGTGNNLTGSAVGPYFQSDCAGISARFTGATSQMVSIARSAGLRPSLQRLSVSCWIKPANVTGIKGIARGQDGNGWDNSWRMILNNDVFNPRITTDQGSAEVYYSGIPDSVWSHVVMTYDGKQLKCYVNGVLQNTANLTGNILYYPSIQESMQLGFANGDYYFNGQMDEFRFYSGDLNATEVLALYNLHKDSFECVSLLLTSLSH